MSMGTARQLAEQALQKAFEAGSLGGSGIPVRFYIILDGSKLPIEPNSMSGEPVILTSTNRAELEAKLMWLHYQGVGSARIVEVKNLITSSEN